MIFPNDINSVFLSAVLPADNMVMNTSKEAFMEVKDLMGLNCVGISKGNVMAAF